jgi:molybdopterin/thiamine biosynthesis adenylyltransferase/rhodanese-related sulfurtransferase
MNLSKAELLRYSRHIKLREVGIKGQEALKSAKVLVIGAGGLGCPVLQYLSAAGVGLIGIIDAGTIDVSNLQRQVLYSQSDINLPKAKTAALKLKTQNPNVNFKVANVFITKENALTLIEPFDIVVDCTDNFPTHYLINDACILSNKPLVFGAIHQFDGQVSVFNFNNGPSYRCLYPEAPTESKNSSEAGVLGVLPGIIGTIQANEVLKIILEIGEVLSGKILSLNSLNYQISVLEFEKTEFASITALSNYKNEYFMFNESIAGTINALSLDEMRKSKPHMNILDVREYFEWDICHIRGASNIPMNLIDECIDEISKTIPTVVVCHHGVRSMNVIDYLKTKGYTNLINLEGGIHAWATDVDKEMAKY